NLWPHKPIWPEDYPSANYAGNAPAEKDQAAWNQFKHDRERWNLRYEAAGPGPGSVIGGDDGYFDAGDLAGSLDEFKRIELVDAGKHTYRLDGIDYYFAAKPFGRLRTWPFFENRGPNPVLLLTGRAGTEPVGPTHTVPWQRGGFVDWLIRDQ